MEILSSNYWAVTPRQHREVVRYTLDYEVQDSALSEFPIKLMIPDKEKKQS